MASSRAASVALLLFVSIMVRSSARAAEGPASAAPAPTPTTGGGTAPAPSPGNMGCDDALLNVSACLTYVEDGSNQTVPDTGCCPGLASLVHNKPMCLCQLLSTSEIYGIQINTTKALKLPAVCRVQTPSVSLCAVLGIPVPSPTESMSPAPASGGPMEPGTASATPVSAPPSQSAAGTISGANGLLVAGALFFIATMSF